MINFIIKRFTYGILVILGVILVVFFLFHALPGDPVAMMAGQRSDLATKEAITREFGLDKPLPVQLYLYVKDLSPIAVYQDTPENQAKYEYTVLFRLAGNVAVFKRPYLRRGFQTKRRVGEIIQDKLASTFWLALTAMVFATIVGIFFGVLAALNQNSFWDHVFVSGSILGISIPSFVSSAVIGMIFGFYLSDFTGLNVTGQLWQVDPFEGRKLMLKNLILPAFTLGIRPLSIIVQLTRSSMLEVLGQDYIRTAHSKGLAYYTIVFKHVLKNALNPVITSVSGWLASLMAGAFFVEVIFDWKGLGYTTISAVTSLDFPVVMGVTLFFALVFVIINILVDVVYAMLDPRVRLH